MSASPYYREALGADAAATPLERLPTLSKPVLMDQWDRIACDPRVRRAGVEAHATGAPAGEPYLGEFQVFSTSGASGRRGLFVYGARDWAAVHRPRHARDGAYRRATWGARDRHRVAARASTCPTRIHAALQSGDAVPRLSALTPLHEMVAALNAFQPEVLFGYPTVGALLASEQLAGRLSIAPRLLAFGSEPLTAEMRDRIREAWGIDPVEYYASTEAPTTAASTPEHPRALELFEDQFVVEIVDDGDRPVPPGTAGAKVLVTNLDNRTLPLIRYELADRVIESPEPNPAGRPYRHLAGIDGRTADTLTFPARDGGTVAVLPLRMGAPFARLPAVRQFQIVHEPGRLEVRAGARPAGARGHAGPGPRGGRRRCSRRPERCRRGST